MEQTAHPSAELQQFQHVQEDQITAQQLRIAKLESLHKLAQDSAIACESELNRCQRSLEASKEQNKALLSELSNSKCVHSVPSC